MAVARALGCLGGDISRVGAGCSSPSPLWREGEDDESPAPLWRVASLRCRGFVINNIVVAACCCCCVYICCRRCSVCMYAFVYVHVWV
jgi:hypothetical protein